MIESKICHNCKRFYRSEIDFLGHTSRWRKCDRQHLWFDCRCGSTLMLPKGKYSWYREEEQLQASFLPLFNRIVDHMPYIPSRVMGLVQLSQRPDIDVSELARELKFEPFLADQVFKLATQLRDQRSPQELAFESLEYAVSYIGLAVFRDLLVVASLKQFPYETRLFSHQNFWEEAELTARLAEMMALRLGENRDHAFHAGVLVNIGKMLMAYCFPTQCDLIQSSQSNPSTFAPWHHLEKGYHLHDHVILGQMAASLWGLSPYISDVIEFHHQPERLKLTKPRAASQRFCAVIGLANQLCHWHRLQPEQIDHPDLQSFGEILGLPEREIEKWMKDFRA